jgi:Ca2+-binding EF-hand superfamily protein
LPLAGDSIKSVESEKIANLTILNNQESRLNKVNSLVFQPLISILHKLEVEKEALARCEDFSLEAVFLMFAKSTVDKLSKTDLISRLCSLGITCEAHDVDNLVSRFDSDFDSKLSLWEFLNMFAPLRSNLRAAIENRPTQDMCNQTIQRVKSVLSKHIDTERMCAQIRA